MTLLMALALTATGSGADVRSRLVGSWRLVTWVSFDESGRSRPGNYDTGLVTYDMSGQMSAQLMRAAGRPKDNPTTDATRAAAYNSYIGYWGPFTLDEAKGTVVHHVVGSSFPHWVGTDQVRYFKLSEDGRTLQLSVKSGGRVTSILTWARVE
jgi:hypothetical protein